MNIQLPPDREKFIQTQITTGRYENASAVITKALKLLEEWEKGYQNWVGETRHEIEIGTQQLDRGEGIDGEIVVGRLRDKLRQARENLA
ncbi:type II toxin-antitoxin system ParD family antitoxin [Merismopedia glauca]|uniref:Type II toxin-antitoxin system ParD family antitoxin n=1 Tax=Merismopedia glauca CCAP 1448/3 TaxID=1296344 RepID=A0A2T1BYR1_9CYAN|nr:type II toxin-antitoxin system ParD family antitoxin [Merismopedia glauca]PSB01028.1 type II toxin-antitoxin system ParD family antitoxin [Merismopedia glauca CCAP 1448/3]